MYEKFKSFFTSDNVFTVILVILIAVISFALGRNSVTEDKSLNNVDNSATIVFTDVTDTEMETPSYQSVVASKSGTKYHLLTCPGAKSIKEANKIYFDSIELAKAAGYEKAKNCKGL